jgi:hypothetical protein
MCNFESCMGSRISRFHAAFLISSMPTKFQKSQATNWHRARPSTALDFLQARWIWSVSRGPRKRLHDDDPCRAHKQRALFVTSYCCPSTSSDCISSSHARDSAKPSICRVHCPRYIGCGRVRRFATSSAADGAKRVERFDSKEIAPQNQRGPVAQLDRAAVS